MDKVILSVLGLSASQSQSGAYALILQEEGRKSRIPIIIGSAEAQAIAIALEGLKPPRPLTHDLFVKLSLAYDLFLLEVIINKIEEGIFYSQLVFKGDKGNVTIDARTSDAVALAIRFQAPIYATTTVLQKAGIVLDEPDTKVTQVKTPSKKEQIAELREQLLKAIKNEDYESAAEIKKQLALLTDSDDK